ncbi:M48 family metallopeptidase [Magnetospirillum aberrantis]|uniref:M48 family metalloprotease n=1 Tax=Magnetospirillum aberrantis SpK TaxID=908842 RepID=A0A7C9UU36_9PROT|nr:M48 family metallopeptidase [Magnetospirillum aberrantis]NFV80026.1 M48 family metalloprotease [Magnetospirillum aberrantis SpK]
MRQAHYLSHAGIAVGVGLLLASCAPTTQRPGTDPAKVEAERAAQKKLVFEKRQQELTRLQFTFSRLVTAAAPLCPEKVASLGMAVHSRADYVGIEAAEDAGIGGRPMVLAVIPGGPADRAGIKVGDELLSIGPEEVSRFRMAQRSVRNAMGSDPGPRAVKVKRGDTEMVLTAQPDMACAYTLDYQPRDNVINAYADGSAVLITGGMARFAENDELALVMAHEIAHNARDHVASKRAGAITGMILGSILDGLVGALAGGASTGGAFGRMGEQAGGGVYSQDYEAEADYVGLYIMARAGYAIDGAPTFWRKMAEVNPDAISRAYSHPTTPERLVAMDAAVAEIKAKLAAGQPLAPNEKAAAEAVPTSPAP